MLAKSLPLAFCIFIYLLKSFSKDHWLEIMIENEIRKVSKYLLLTAGKLSYTENNIIQMKAGEISIVGFSSIINHFHNVCERENETSEIFFLVKQYFDFANLFIRSTSKKDRCKLSQISSP